MKLKSFSHLSFRILLIPLSLVLTIVAISFVVASINAAPNPPGPLVGEFDVCIPDGYSCTANDVRIEALDAVQVITGCRYTTISPITQTMNVRFRVSLSSFGLTGTSPDRYDIGAYISQNGRPVQGNDQCFHDWFEPPITATVNYTTVLGKRTVYKTTAPFPPPNNYTFNGFWNGETNVGADICGDIEGDSRVVKVLTQTFEIACVDRDNNQVYDTYACASWDNNRTTTCTGVGGAVPGTGSKCSCGLYNFLPYTQTAATVQGFNAFGIPGKIMLSWETASETGMLGFNIWRADSLTGDQAQINQELIPRSDGGMGTTHSFIDANIQPGKTYYYWLVVVGDSPEQIGPVKVTAGSSWLYLPAIRR
jgi:hypothetical protein